MLRCLPFSALKWASEEILEIMKFHDLMESLKTNKDMKDIPRYVGEHVLPVLELKQDQTIKKALELLEAKYSKYGWISPNLVNSIS